MGEGASGAQERERTEDNGLLVNGYVLKLCRLKSYIVWHIIFSSITNLRISFDSLQL